MEKALRYAFVKNQDDNGKRILSQAIKMKDKLVHLCSASFKERNYLFVLDDFEQNLEGYEKGEPGPLLPEAAELLRVLLHYLPLSEKKSQLLITSRYEFSHSHEEQNPVDERLEKIWLTGFRKAEQSKKLRELPNIFVCKDPVLAKQLLEAGHGNPRLMEWIDLLAAQLKAKEMKELAAEIADRQQDFIHEHVIRELLKKGGVKLGLFLRLFSIYRIPVLEEGVKSVAEQGGVKDWQKLLRKGMALSLAEHDQARDSYQVTPLLREEFFKKLEGYLLPCHEAAFAYFKKLCELRKSLDPVLTEEWIYHALGCGKEDVASRQGGQLVNHLREHLAFPESRRIGEWILCIKKQELSTEHDAILINELGNTIHKMGDHLKALTHYQQALDIWRKIFGEQHHYIAIAMNSLASAWIDSDEPNKAIEYLEKALEIDRVGLNPQHPNLAIYLNNLGEIFRVLGKPTKAIEYFQQALAIWKKTYGEMHPRVATAMNNLGMTWDYLGKSQMATEYLKKALNIHITILGMHHPNVALGFNNLGVIWNSLGNYHETIGFFQQALNIWIKIYGKIHPQVAATINNIGSVLENLGEPHKAIEYYQEALEIDKIVFGSLHQAVARELNNLGGAWETLGEPRKAIYYYQQSIDILKKVYSEKHPQVATAINNLGEAWKLFGKPRKAVKYFQQALEIDEAIFGRQHPNVATRLNNLGEAYRVLGKPRQAIAYYQQALDIVTKAYGEMHPYVAATTNNIGSAYFDLGEMDRAKVYFERSYTIKLKIFGPDHPRSKLTAECLDECCKKEP
jgi:tetratricopeptide (TPR) repeat protein